MSTPDPFVGLDGLLPMNQPYVPRHEATFPVRIFRHPDGEWWVECFHSLDSKASWDAGGYETYEEAKESAMQILGEAFDSAFNCGDV